MRPRAAAGVRPNPPALDPRRPGRPQRHRGGGAPLPHGALHYRLLAAEPEEPTYPTTITRDPAGPLLVRGDLVLDTPDGTLDETRAALCACGRTQNQPFCDGACGVNAGSSGGTRDQAETSPQER